MSRSALLAPPAIVIGAAAVVAVLGVGGEFPLNDDWSYAWAVRTLCHEGHLRLLQWTGASVIAQVGWGALVCRLFGFSFVALRISTLAIATVGVLAWYALLARIGIGGTMLAVATVLLALDPLYVNLAFTFMTDVPFTALCVIAGWCYVRGLQERDGRALVAGSIAAAVALLVRQHGIFLPAAAALALVFFDDGAPARRLRRATAAALVPAVTFIAYHAWLFTVQGAPSGYTNKIGEAQRVGALMVANCAFRGVQYLGLLTAPLAPALLRDPRLAQPRRLAAWLGAIALPSLFLWWREGALLFNLPNVLYDFGVGPVSLRDTHVLGLPPPTHLGLALRLPLTVAAIVSAAVLCGAGAAAIAWLRSASASGVPAADASSHAGGVAAPVSTRTTEAFLVFGALLLFAGTLLQSRYYFDRYLLPVLPFAIAAVLAHARPRAPTAAGLVLTAVLAWFAVAGTHDYLAWNRARFAGLDDLARAGVPPTEIDGGFEYNAWQLAPTLGHWPTDAEARVGQPADRRSWWWVVDDRLIASFRELPHYRVRETIPFERWLVPGTGRIFILERAAG